MSSWFSLPLPNPFKSDDDDDAGGEKPSSSEGEKMSDPNSSSIKEDFSAISQTFSHHLRGVASFLAPPSPTQSSEQVPSSEKFSGIKNDLVEIGDSFKSGLSLFSSNKAVSEISKLASNFLQFSDESANDRETEDEDRDDDDDDDDYEEEIVGITDEVVEFVSTISQRPQLWTDFPLSLPTDFTMSDSQKEHVASIEQFVPGLDSMRQKVCHELSDGQYWMIYFVLLLPRLNGNDLELLSTPEIVEVRETLLQQLQSKKNPQPEASKESETVDASEKDVKVSGQQQGSESKLEEKNISADTANASQDKDSLHGEKPQQQLEDEKTKTTTSFADKDEDDVSFSDLEDDDTDLSDRLQGSKPTHRKKVSSSSESHEWIQLNENSKAQGSQQKAGQSIHRDKDSEGEESNDWLTVDDIDSDSLATN
ncbi:PREDICTED: probable serine/threonine-protein kinase kinX isoform X2 [Nicotiana attenuata]|uniref:probable serine/threonine-protein kinase kinX isoform X2 n=1 Tax=Nicotiana attenuata TaxID=49451 RepID=UPI0009054C71|nr:PREDICTED: probable serine/threonine-protein kinase kinX isoform X2 [Nicotiana attenuata]